MVVNNLVMIRSYIRDLSCHPSIYIAHALYYLFLGKDYLHSLFRPHFSHLSFNISFFIPTSNQSELVFTSGNMFPICILTLMILFVVWLGLRVVSSLFSLRKGEFYNTRMFVRKIQTYNPPAAYQHTPEVFVSTLAEGFDMEEESVEFMEAFLPKSGLGPSTTVLPFL